MEEIAASLGISKKTLYKFFSNKDHLLRELVESQKCEAGKRINAILDDQDLNFMEKLKRFLSYVGSQSSKFQGPMMMDLMRNNPGVWNDLREFRRTRTTEKITKLLAEGSAQGFIRSDVNKEIATIMYVSAVHSIIAPEALDEIPLPAEAVMREIMKILFEGVLTEYGRHRYAKNYEEPVPQEVI
jgi:AcrR family transcriptional regulator